MLRKLRARLPSLKASAARARAELLTTAAIALGWALLTWGLARLLVVEVWFISAGLALLSVAGWRMLGEIAWRGLYVLTREADRG